MPLPNSISQHVAPLATPQAGGYPSQAPASVPSYLQPQSPQAWQQPQMSVQPMPGSIGGENPAGLGGGILPPRRPEGMPPQPLASGAGAGPMSTVLPRAPLYGDTPMQPMQEPGLPMARGTGAPMHSSLIPGAPVLPVMGAPGAAPESQDFGSLLGRDIAPQPLASGGAAASSSQAGEAPVSRLAAAEMRNRQQGKTKRGSNVFVFSLVLLLLAGTLLAVGWMFKAPIMQMVNRYLPGNQPVVNVPRDSATPVTPPKITPANPPKAPQPVTIASAPDTPPATSSVMPTQDAEPAPKKATPATADEIAAASAAGRSAPGSTPTASPSPGGGLSEITPKVSTTPGAPASTESPSLPMTSEVQIEVTEEARPAAEALRKFLDAPNLKERLKYTLAPEMMEPMMKDYYAVTADGPVRVDTIALVRFDPKPQVGGGAHAVFGLSSKAWEYAIPVMLEETGGKYRVDWLSFVEFKDRFLEKFLSSYQEGPGRFHVGITRQHFFEDTVPNPEKKEAFRINPPPPNPYEAHVLVEKDSAIARDLKDKIPWGTQVWAIVELEWVRLGNQQWVQLVGVPQLNWYSVPGNTNASKSGGSNGRAPEMPTETQKAVPIGR